MNFSIFLFFLIVCCNVKCESDEYDDENTSDEINDISAFDSDSHEVYNMSLSSKPSRINVGIRRNKTLTTDKPFYENSCAKLKIGNEGNQKSCRSSVRTYPYSASIQKKGSHYASGALVDKRWVLSVAAEFYNVRETIRLFKVRLGSLNSKKDGVLLRITRLEIHPSFVPKKPSYDLSLLRLALPVVFTDYIKPISISGINSVVLKANFLTTYWPRLIVHGMVLPKQAKERIKSTSMRVSIQKVIPWEDCSHILDHLDVILNKNSLCMRPLISHHSVCMPDIGAPVVADNLLWGITSGWISEDCKQVPSPTIFSRTSSPVIRSWLNKYRAIP